MSPAWVEGKVSVCAVSWNSQEYMRRCLESLRRQDYSALEVWVVDNASSDGTAKIVGDEFPEVHLLRNGKNIGFSGALNQCLRVSRGEYFLSLNPDVFLTPSYVSRSVEAIKRGSRIGMVCGKLLRYDLDGMGETEIIDSAGVSLKRNRRLINRGEGEPDGEEFQKEVYVFAGCAAATLYRKRMLFDLRYQSGEVFDESFFAYKEDGDIGWRAGLLGWKCLYAPSAVAFHCRRWRTGGRNKVPRAEKYHSFKNRYMMILKNEEIGSLIKNAIPIFGYEVAALLYATVREPFLWRSYLEVLRRIPEVLQKRREIMKKRTGSLAAP